MARSGERAITKSNSEGDPLTLGDVIRFLGDPTTYGEAAGTVETVETHWSWLFLTPSLVFKLKKPLWRPWINLRTLEARRQNCLAELELNRRLTIGVYRRTVPLCRSQDGALTLGGDGAPVEWLLEMTRLPAARMFDTLLRQGDVAGTDVNGIGARLAGFYADQPAVRADGHLYLEHLRVEAAENRRLLTKANLGLPPARVRRVLDHVDRLLHDLTPRIEQRIADGHVVEGHGDLRPEHVCLTDPIQIFDCLEFDRAMRILDPFDEVNYLGLESELLGAGWVRPRLLAILDDTVGARPPPQLMTFYSAFRATLRARICLAHLDEEFPTDPDRWPRDARAYLHLADEELCRL